MVSRMDFVSMYKVHLDMRRLRWKTQNVCSCSQFFDHVLLVHVAIKCFFFNAPIM